MNTIDRILELVNESGLTAKEFAENANIAGGSITDWKTGRSKPSVESLQKISKYTGVQLDWLTGDSEFKTKDQELDGFLKNKNSILILKTIHRYYYEFVVPCKLKEKDIYILINILSNIKEVKQTKKEIEEYVSSFEDVQIRKKIKKLISIIIKEIIESLGGKTVDSVSKKTSVVIVGENPGSKYQKAKELEIEIWEEKEFEEKIREK